MLKELSWFNIPAEFRLILEFELEFKFWRGFSCPVELLCLGGGQFANGSRLSSPPFDEAPPPISEIPAVPLIFISCLLLYLVSLKKSDDVLGGHSRSTGVHDAAVEPVTWGPRLISRGWKEVLILGLGFRGDWITGCLGFAEEDADVPQSSSQADVFFFAICVVTVFCGSWSTEWRPLDNGVGALTSCVPDSVIDTPRFSSIFL